jgi:hypothetical protein
MKKKSGYRAVPFTMNRRMASASASVCRNRNSIHAITEVDITVPRRIMRAHREQTGEPLSLTAYVIACLAHAVADHSSLNSFRRGGKLLLLDDVNVSTLVERELGGERIPEPFGIREAQAKSFRQIHEEIRAAQRHVADGLGGLSGMRWVRFIPGFLLRAFIRAASHSLFMMRRFGTVSVTVGSIVDGAPAVRFVERREFSQIGESSFCPSFQSRRPR